MKIILPLATAVLIALTSFGANANCRAVSRSESTQLNSAAYKFFERIYGNRVELDLNKCAKKSKFTICENDTIHGTYIYGKLVASKKSFDCNMSIVRQKIVAADCGDE